MIEKKKEKGHIPAATAFPFGEFGKKKLRIIFMGTPEFAVASLDRLVHAGYDIAAVITAPDKRAGRGMELQQSVVKKYALQMEIPVLQPEKLKDDKFLQQLKSLDADLHIVVAFRMLPEAVWNMSPMGTINVHASLLPQYRGAAPVNWAIINGEKFTGVTTFKLQHEIDTGNILLQTKVEINDDETAGELHDKLKETGALLLLKTIEELAKGTVRETSQHPTSNTKQLLPAPKIFTETCKIIWQKDVSEVYNLIRGLSPYPTAFTEFQGKKLKIFRAEKIMMQPQTDAGNFETDQSSYLRFACINGYIDVIGLQLQGKKRMGVKEFLRGYRFL